MKDLLRISDLSPRDLEVLLNLGAELKARPLRHQDSLRGELVVLLFEEPSTRTRLHFEQAAVRLGAHPVFVTRDQLQLSRGEWVRDTARTFGELARFLVVRSPDHSEIEAYAADCTASVVNGLSELHHPTQALADLAALRARFGQLDSLKVAYVGDGANVCHSLLEAVALVGMDIAIATPAEYYAPDPAVIGRAHDLARVGGGSVDVGTDPHTAVKDADVVYTDAWISVDDIESQHQVRRELLEPYRVDAELMAEAAPGAVFLHALPAHRGEEVTSDVLDSPRSIVRDQVAHGTPMVQAVLFALADGRLEGR